VSRFFDAVRRADEARQRPPAAAHAFGPEAPLREARPFRVVSVVSNKGGVGKTTIATNLAIYLCAMREDVPILLVGLDDQDRIDRMFALGSEPPRATIADALRSRALGPAIRLGQYGVSYVPTSGRIGELKRELEDPELLGQTLARSGWRGLVIVDTKSDLEILTQNALAASDLALVLVRDLTSLVEAVKVFDLLAGWRRPPENARVLLSLIDRRVKYARGEQRDLLALLLAEIRERGLPLFETFVSSSPKIESLHSNPEHATLSILHAASGSLVHRQMHHLAAEVLKALEAAPPV
jgi:cellulose biosynthesis protein BcsQ